MINQNTTQMPLSENNNITYYTIDTDEVALKTKVGEDKYETGNVYEAWLADVEYREGTYNNKPANKYMFKFVDADGNTEYIQSGESSVFSSSLINRLLNVEGEYGKIRLGVYTSEGGYIVPWVYHDGHKLNEKYDFDQFNAMAERSFSGDKTALAKKLFETELKPKIEQQGTYAETITSSGDKTKTAQEEPQAVPAEATKAQSANTPLEDIDDDLPF